LEKGVIQIERSIYQKASRGKKKGIPRKKTHSCQGLGSDEEKRVEEKERKNREKSGSSRGKKKVQEQEDKTPVREKDRPKGCRAVGVLVQESYPQRKDRSDKANQKKKKGHPLIKTKSTPKLQHPDRIRKTSVPEKKGPARHASGERPRPPEEGMRRAVGKKTARDERREREKQLGKEAREIRGKTNRENRRQKKRVRLNRSREKRTTKRGRQQNTRLQSAGQKGRLRHLGQERERRKKTGSRRSTPARGGEKSSPPTRKGARKTPKRE